ncbi:MAG: MFS transporter [Mediterraneibacter sp.]
MFPFPFYIEYLGGSEAVAGFAAALFSIIAVVFRPFIGWMLDNGKRKIILIIGLCGMALRSRFRTPRLLPSPQTSFRSPDLLRAWECSVWQRRSFACSAFSENLLIS